MHRCRRKMPCQSVRAADARDQGVDGDAADFLHQFLGGERERRRVDFQINHLVERSDRGGTLAALAVQEPDFADDIAARELGQRAITLLYLDLAFDDETERFAFLAILHDDGRRRQDAPGRQTQQFPHVDVVELAQKRQAAHGLPFGLVGQYLAILENLETHRRQVLGHVGAQAVARVQVLFQRPHDHLVGEIRQIGIELRDRDCLGIDDLVDQGGGVGAAKRQPTGKQLVEHHPERIQVGLVIERVALDLLRAHVGRRTETVDEGGVNVHVLADVERQPEVHQLDLVVLGQHDVGRLDVAMHDAAPVRVVQRHRDFEDDADHPMHGKQLVHGDKLVQAGALDQFHHQVGTLVLDMPVEHPRDVGVVELRRDRRLGGEQLAEPA